MHLEDFLLGYCIFSRGFGDSNECLLSKIIPTFLMNATLRISDVALKKQLRLKQKKHVDNALILMINLYRHIYGQKLTETFSEYERKKINSRV